MNTKKQIANLAKMKVNELQAKYAELFGKETHSRNKAFLLRKVAEALQPKGDCTGVKNTNPRASAMTANTEAATAAEIVTEQVSKKSSERLTKLAVPELQARYLEVVGRQTGSSDKPYLIWKIREARKGRVPIGPRKSTRTGDVTFKILPLRMEAAVVDKLDEAWKRLGLHSRMDLFRKSLQGYLAGVGETEVAALLTDAASEGR
jgi:hypothetical protein